MKTTTALIMILVLAPFVAATEADAPLPTVAEKTAGLERVDGLLTTWLDRDRGRVYLEVPVPGEHGVAAEMLYVEGLLTGLGSNPVGLDRGQLGPARLVQLRRLGERMLLEELNLGFRALTHNADEKRAVRESFATSVLWAEKIAALDPDGRSLVDLRSFLVSDAHGVVARLEATGQGSFVLDDERSVVDVDAFLAFPDNLEFEAVLTFAGKTPGELVTGTAPTAESVTLVQHHSLIRLPDDGYAPRRFDPRAGSFPIVFADYAAPLDEPIETRWIVRHRLTKTDPTAERSTVTEPIIYYVDRGAPEPVRSALVEGASWWAEAFEAAGFIDAYRVEVLPEGVHPLDVRYNVIQWVHRSTRGWSYGGGIVDPRTGEMIKGHVSLGSLRVRHDRLLIEGLVGADLSGGGGPNDPVEVALARIRQLAAHEVGHTLGFTHNFAASTYGGRASVMDYPAPLVKITDDGELDLSDAYGVGVGTWDIYTVRYAYQQPVPGESEDALLASIIADGLERELFFMSDDDARPAGSAHPRAHLWDNGSDAAAALDQTFEVRRIAIKRFGERNLAAGQPLSRLVEVFSPLYLSHRYQLTAAVKLVGGVDYSYAVKGDGQGPAHPVNGGLQRRALDAVLHGLDPTVLVVPDAVAELLLPPAFGYGRSREELATATAPVFDRMGAAATAADLVVASLLVPERCQRLVEQSLFNPTLPSLEEVLESMTEAAFNHLTLPPGQEEIRRVVQRVLVEAMVDRIVDPATPPAVRSRLDAGIAEIQVLVDAELAGAEGAERIHLEALRDDLARFRDLREWEPGETGRAAEPPPGDPIGGALPGCSHDSTGWR
jgi:hypothetical protein